MACHVVPPRTYVLHLGCILVTVVGRGAAPSCLHCSSLSKMTMIFSKNDHDGWGGSQTVILLSYPPPRNIWFCKTTLRLAVGHHAFVQS